MFKTVIVANIAGNYVYILYLTVIVTQSENHTDSHNEYSRYLVCHWSCLVVPGDIFMFFILGCCDDSHRKPCQVIISICLLGVRVWYWEEEKPSLGVVDGTVEVFTLLRDVIFK